MPLVQDYRIRPQRGWPLACTRPSRDAGSDGAGCSSDEAGSDQDINGQLAEVHFRTPRTASGVQKASYCCIVTLSYSLIPAANYSSSMRLWLVLKSAAHECCSHARTRTCLSTLLFTVDRCGTDAVAVLQYTCCLAMEQLYADIRERQTAMEAAVAAEDYAAAAAQRDAVDGLMLRRRLLEIAASAEARKVRFRPGPRLALIIDRNHVMVEAF